MTPRRHVEALTGVRFLAALWVVLYHVGRHHHDLLEARVPGLLDLVWPVLGAGAFGVDLFFMLSGYVLAHSYLDRMGGRVDVGATARFLWLRLARIWPLYVLVVLGAGALRVLRHELWGTGRVGLLTLDGFVRQALLVQQWFPPAQGPRSWFGPAWSLSAEWLAYLCFPLLVVALARVRGRLRARALLALALLALVPFWAGVVARGDMGGGVWVLRILCEFSAGMLVCAAVARLRPGRGVRRLGDAAVVVALVGGVAWLQLAGALRSGVLFTGVVAFFVPLLLGLAVGGGPVTRVLSTRWLVLGGGLSYALYLVHSPLLYLYRDVTRYTGLLHLDPGPALLGELVLVPVMVVVAWALFRFVEEPLRHRLAGMLPTASTGSGAAPARSAPGTCAPVPEWVRGLLLVLAAVVVLWALTVVAFYLAGRRAGEPTRLREALRVLPDVVRLLRRLAGDRSLPRGVRWRLWLLLAYLALPVDLVPDVIPVAGYADDVLLVAWVLRSVVRTAGPEALDEHWPGTPEGLALVRRLVGLPAEGPSRDA